MNLSSLRAALSRIPAHVSGWTETNIEEIRWDVSAGIIAEFDLADENALRAELKEANETRDTALKNCEKAEEHAEKAEEEAAALREEMAALKDPSEDGENVATYRKRAIQAEQDAEAWREHARKAAYAVQDMQKELDALRKRKGVEPAVIPHLGEMLSLVRSLRERMGDNLQPQAQRLLDRMRETQEKQNNAGKAPTKRAA